MTASKISLYLDAGYVYVYMESYEVKFGELASASQEASLREKNVWVLTAGYKRTTLAGDNIMRIEK